eukprot:COSAG04_NODE_13367_length_609_cov_0.909804_1_plen_43_part_01
MLPRTEQLPRANEYYNIETQQQHCIHEHSQQPTTPHAMMEPEP